MGMFKKDPKSLVFIALGFLLPALAARATRTLAGGGFRLLTNQDAPKNPAHHSTGWKDALLWAVISGAIGGVTRLSTRRLLSETVIPAEGDDMDREIRDIA